MVYIDDIIIYSDSNEQHLEHLNCVLELLQQANLRIGYDKCEIFTNKVELLGHTISHKEVRPLQSRVEKILRIPSPQDKTQLKSFLGICNYYRNFVPNYSTVTSILYGLLKNKVEFVWERKHENAFNSLK